MKARSILAGALGASLIMVLACSATDEPTMESSNEDASGPEVAAASDAGGDAPLDVEDAGDAATDASSPCTAGGWCETSVPSGADGGVLSLVDVWAHDDADAWAIAATGEVVHWDGQAWSVVWNAGASLRAMWGASNGTIWAVGAAGTLIRHTPGSAIADWQTIDSGLSSDLKAVCVSTVESPATESLWTTALVSGNATIYHWRGETDSAGRPQWTTTAAGTGTDVNALWCSDKLVWAAGISQSFPRNPLIMRYDGSKWINPTKLPATGVSDLTLRSIWAANASELWVSTSPLVFRGSGCCDGETEWSSFSVQSGPLPMDIWGTSASDVWVVGKHGRIYHWDGTELRISITSRDGVVLPKVLRAVSGTSNDVWVVGDDVALHRQN